MFHRLLVATVPASPLLPAGLPFPMPRDVPVDGRSRRVGKPGGHATPSAPASVRIDLDPEDGLLRRDR